MTEKYDHTQPVWKIRERFILGQLKESLDAVNALLKRTENLKEKLEKAIETLEERQHEK